MPRLAPSLFRRAGRISPHLATLLPACRTLESAQIELRWIRRHVQEITRRTQSAPNNPDDTNEDNQKNGAALFLRNGEDPRRHRAKIKPKGKPGANSSRCKAVLDEDRVARLVARRGAGEPLQYVLGTQPFGDLEILCEKGVLIPRPETEAWASMLADLVFSSPEGKADDLRILDLCSGTGCIGLSLFARGMAALSRAGYINGENTEAPLRVFGLDVESRAVRLARRNLMHNFRGSRHGAYLDRSGLAEEALKGAITFRQANIFADEWMAYLDEAKPRECEKGDKQDRARRVDILVSNPPYISQRGFDADTGRSVRNYEPKLALVPPGVSSSLSTATIPTSAALSSCAPEDIFYARLLEIADKLRPRIAVFEVGDMKQAIRVAEMALSRSRSPSRSAPETTQSGEGDEPMGQTEARWDVVEIWRDVPDCRPSDAEEDVIFVRGREVPVRGSGHGRAVFLAEGQMMRNKFTNRGFRQEVYTDS
ncbi:S-adenosyl-L-methionine-dependent methyltransferase [Xylaria sp. FL0043]|nr:S-adenosyl-L-methionine-dependent methyltransferase [Xylaria sp. FL0043]